MPSAWRRETADGLLSDLDRIGVVTGGGHRRGIRIERHLGDDFP